MNDKRIGSAEFKSSCLKIIDQINRDKRPVTITRRGAPAARLLPIQEDGKKGSIIGAMKGSVLRYDDPFGPASDWHADSVRRAED